MMLRRKILALGALLPFVSSPAAARRRRKRRLPHPRVSPTDAAPVPASPADQSLPETVRIFRRSYQEEAAGRMPAALEALNALREGDRASYLALLRRGWLLYQAARHADAIAAYSQALAKEPASIEARLGRLLPRMALRQWPAVEAGAREVVELDPVNYLAGLRLAYAVFNQGRFAEAERLYRRTLARYPSDAELRAGVGWSLLKSGKPGEARQMFVEALAAAPESALILKGLAACDRPA
jgi:tetratricopeptide (TPR) repeat protein